MTHTTVRLKIRTPCLAEGRDMEVDSSWTIQRLKEEIQREWPDHPLPSDQRLIYIGKLLSNDSVLNDVLRFEEGWSDHIMHLVCKQESAAAAAKSTNAITDGLRRRTNVPNAGDAAQPDLPAPQAPPAPQQPDPNWHNLQTQLMYQQYYAQYVQYMQYLHNNQSPQQTINQQQIAAINPMMAAGAAAAAAMGPQQLAAAGPHQQQVVPEAPVAAEQAVADNLGAANAGNIMMNAGAGAMGAMEEDEDDLEGGRRDIFDWFYVLSRVLVLFTVVYSYSSLARFALVAGVFIIVYMYKLGFLGQRPEDVPRAAPQQPEQNQLEQNNHQQPEEQEQQQEVAEQNETPTQVQQPPPPQQWFDLAMTFVTSFFTSMVPDNNDPQVF